MNRTQWELLVNQAYFVRIAVPDSFERWFKRAAGRTLEIAEFLNDDGGIRSIIHIICVGVEAVVHASAFILVVRPDTDEGKVNNAKNNPARVAFLLGHVVASLCA